MIGEGSLGLRRRLRDNRAYKENPLSAKMRRLDEASTRPDPCAPDPMMPPWRAARSPWPPAFGLLKFAAISDKIRV
jgi:hypothetical protein